LKNRKQGKIHLDNIDIREVLDSLQIDYTEGGKNVSGGWIGVSCPFCGDESNHMGINLERKTVSCFKCGVSGTAIKYLTEVLGSFNKAITILGDSVPRELRHFAQEEKQNATYVKLPEEASRVITPYHANYLRGRGFDPEFLTAHYNLHFCGPIGKWANRIIVPVIRQYQLVTFTSVDIATESDMRYRHLKDELSVVGIKDYLYGLEFTDGHTALVVEGLIDKWRMGDGCVATFGTKVTARQKKLLSKFKRIKILFDGDKAGREGSESLASDLAPFTDVSVFDLPDNTDPDKLSAKDIEYLKNA